VSWLSSIRKFDPILSGFQADAVRRVLHGDDKLDQSSVDYTN
jgi:hypothetical protein